MSVPLSEQFKFLNDELCHHDFTVNQLLEKMGERSHAMAIIILSLPFLLPVPLPGLSTIMGIMITWISVYWLAHKKIWVPKKWRDQILPVAVFKRVFEHGEKYAKKIERFFKSRGEVLLHFPVMRLVIFILLVSSAFFLALPLPPGTNFPPALTLISLALALVFEDIVLLLIGIGFFALTSTVTVVAVRFVWAQSLPYIQSFLNWY